MNQSVLVCWWCVHPASSGLPVSLPLKYDSKLNKFETIGNFCSWQCAKAYALDMGTSRSGEVQSFLAMMRRRCIGRYESLWPAPKRQALACFGGSMTIEEFRSYGGLVEPPIIHWPFEKKYVATIDGNGTTAASQVRTTGNAGRLAAIENASAETDTLKLKRNKPLSRSTSKLENVLGITRKGKE